MAQQLEEALEELGISQYLNAFLDQGFDTWETILDITESDLDALGVKLGHRRKLQRRIANFRGIAADVALTSPTRATTDELPRLEPKPDAGTYSDGRNVIPGVLAKRKYRRHPKPDESAPERPPSAYVLFSNKMREDLKGKNLSFTEIAKLVGENWQTLAPAERKPFETQAQAAKDKYNHDMAEYKKTPEYQRYILYLQEFKARHSTQTQDKDAFKRIKLNNHSTSSHSPPSTSGAGSPASTQRPRQRTRSITASGSVSSNDAHHDRETPQPPSRRERRVGSTVSATDSHYSSASPTPGPQDGPMHSPQASYAADGHLDWSPRRTSMSPLETAARHPSKAWTSDTHPQRGAGESSVNGSQVSLPSLSDMFDNRTLASNGPTPSTTTRSVSPVLLPPSGLANSNSGSSSSDPRSSLPRTGQSCSGASTSTSSTYSSSYPRTPMDGSLPIHALLSGKPVSPSSSPLISSSALHHRHHHGHHGVAASHSSHMSIPSPQPMHPPASASPEHRFSPPPRPYTTADGHQATYYTDHAAGSMLHSNGGGFSYSPVPATPDNARVNHGSFAMATVGEASSIVGRKADRGGMNAVSGADTGAERRARGQGAR